MIKVARLFLIFLLLFAGRVSFAQPAVFQVSAPKASQVELFSSFKHWAPLMMKKNNSGVWIIELDLPPGRYEYLFKVDSVWLLDATQPRLPDGIGGYNSFVIIK